MPWWKRWFGAPLPVVLVGMVATLAWSLAYGSSRGQADDKALASTSSPAIVDLANRTGPRLLKEAPPGELGLDIAIQDRDGKSMTAFAEAIKRVEAGTGQARLLFYGASHVAGDVFTGYIRRELQRRYGDAGHGFVVPVHPWRTYRHRDIVIESNHLKWKTHRIVVSDDHVERVGLGGVAMQTSRAGNYGRVRTSEQGDFGRSAGVFELYYFKQPRGGEFEVLIDGKVVKRISTRAPRYRAGYATFRVEDGPHSFEVRVVGRGPVRVFGVVVEREEPGVVVDTLGINGSRARYQLLWDEALFTEHLRRRNPDLVVLAYGTNEAGDDTSLEVYRERVDKVVARVVKTVPDASCLLIGPSDRPLLVEEGVYEARPRTAQLIQIQRELAMKHGCGFYDLVAFQGGPMSTVAWAAHDPPYAAQDHIHFTRGGYERLGQALLSALTESLAPPEPPQF